MHTYVGYVYDYLLRFWQVETLSKIFQPSQEPESQVPSNIELDDDAVHSPARFD